MQATLNVSKDNVQFLVISNQEKNVYLKEIADKKAAFLYLNKTTEKLFLDV